MTAEFIAEQRSRFIGAFLARMIEGRWAGDETRLVVPEFQDVQTDIVKDLTVPRHFEWYGALDPAFADYRAKVRQRGAQLMRAFEKPMPGATRSSLMTRRERKPMGAGS